MLIYGDPFGVKKNDENNPSLGKRVALANGVDFELEA